MNPEFDYLYDAGLQAVQDFNNGTGIVVNAYQFASCNDSDFCNNVRPQGKPFYYHTTYVPVIQVRSKKQYEANVHLAVAECSTNLNQNIHGLRGDQDDNWQI